MLEALIQSFPEQTITVIGDVILDTYLLGRTTRLCREAPVPIVQIQEQLPFPGGAANTAANITSLGGDVILVSASGADATGELLRHSLEAQGIGTADVHATSDLTTHSKSRLVSGGQLIARFDRTSLYSLTQKQQAALLADLRLAHEISDAIVIADYGLGIINPAVIATLEELQQRRPKPLIIDSRHALTALTSLRPTWVKPNFAEALALLDLDFEAVGALSRPEFLTRHAAQLLTRTNAHYAAVTLDQDGALLLRHEAAPYRTYTAPVMDSRANGAGDTFVAALALGAAAEAGPEDAMEIATRAAAIVIEKNWTACCQRSELLARISPSHRVIRDLSVLADLTRSLREQGKRLVMTNGCFDLLHSGHVEFLARAKERGDKLIVAVNSDESIARVKGPGRPINTLADRIKVLSSLSSIDYIVPFSTNDACELAGVVKPHLLVKGENYRGRALPEAEVVLANGGQVEFIETREVCSTSDLIERITGGSGQTERSVH